jgi:ubiquinone/menaquinone biosynthesis C-methylase UbiE
MTEQTKAQYRSNQKPRLTDKVAFRMMSFIHDDLYRKIRDPYAVLYAAGLEEGQTVLEVGCGPGFFTVPAARIVGDGGRVYALDINPLAVDKMRRKVSEAGAHNVETVLADAACTGLAREDFDLAFVFGLGRPIGGIDRIWAELHRLLKPGGTLAIEGRLEPPDGLFCATRQYGRVNVYAKIEGQVERESFSSQRAEQTPAHRQCRRRAARRRRWH